MSELNLTPREVFIPVPVSERLPEAGKVVTIVNKDGNIMCCYSALRKGIPSRIWMKAHIPGIYDCSEITHWYEKITAIPLSEEELDTFILGFVNWKDIKWQYVHVAGKFLPNIKFLDKYGSNYKSNSELLSIYKEELSKNNNNTPKVK